MQSESSDGLTVFFYLHRRVFIRVLLAPALLAALVGCRGRAQRDLYQAKMAHEIRVLEDQLYEADYHNRVLIDKLEQIKLKSERAPQATDRGSDHYGPNPTPVPSSGSPQDRVPEPIRDPVPNQTPWETPPELPEFDAGDSSTEPSTPKSSPAPPANLDGLGEIGAMVDEGQPMDPAEITVPSTTDPFTDDPSQAEKEADAEAPAMDAEDSAELLPAPGGPEPPSKRDTEIPPVLPGEILPPSILDEQEDKPPGQILLPDSAQEGIGIPDQLRLHPSLSGGHRVDGKVENMVIVVNVLDERGRPVDLEAFHVNAELSVVLFEAGQNETDEARIGRWDFSSDQVQNFVKSEPISGLHVPIRWQGRQPKGEEMVVHVRLRAEEDEMRCEGRLKVERANAVAEWTPRGELLK